MMKPKSAALLVAAFLFGTKAFAFESDVHFGLTQWLALQAGFTAQQAEAIAIGNNRVDSGDMQYMDLSFVYACLGADDEPAKVISAHQYPTSGAVPGAPEQRAVAAGSDAAQKLVSQVMKAPPGHAGFMLYKLGEALHALQNSWSHEGAPDTPQIDGKLFKCDATRMWAHPHARGGWNSHKADLTMHWPAETIAMAKASYDVLTQYPKITDARAPKPWSQIRPLLDGFVKAATKSEKRAWFASQGIDDAAFLEGTSLKDGAQPFVLNWEGRKLPRLPSSQSRQHHVDAEVLDFYSRFFADWMMSDDLTALAATVASPRGPRAAAGAFVPMDKNELAAHFKLWRMRDHGAAAELAHASQRLTSKQRVAVDALAKAPNALVRYKAPTDAFFPLVTKGKDASPLLPFIVGDAPPSGSGNRRVVATTKLRHAPYDTLAVVAEKIDGQWRVISIVSTVDH